MAKKLNISFKIIKPHEKDKSLAKRLYVETKVNVVKAN